MSILRLREIESVTLSRSAENAETRRVMRVILQIVGASPLLALAADARGGCALAGRKPSCPI